MFALIHLMQISFYLKYYQTNLLQLESKAKFKKSVKVLALPKNNKNIPAYQKCSVAGWGKTEQNSTISSVLREVTLKVQNNTECKEVWQKYFDTDRMICTASDGMNAFCQVLECMFQ